ncbi:MAG: glycosyltransferase family 2 protein [Candidatus Portnoybacteria bacterium]|nr:glycosyltransferase family 2 protein [Candidatus Portnoybacteria bacterium]
MKLSIIVPVYNEEQNIEELYKELKGILGELFINYEIITINDGSKDSSGQVLKKIATIDSNFKVINFRKNFGQTAAISAGIDYASGEILILMDSDLQNDPIDIPRLLKEIECGYDVVSGWRKERKDKLFTRKIPSWLANRLISFITGVRLHDYGCTMKAYKSEVIKDIRLYGEMHRFIPAYTSWHGAKIQEIVVNHRPRKHGKTKYGISRTFRVILDLLTVKFLTDYSTKPMHFFGRIGFWLFGFGFISGVLALLLRFFKNITLIQTPLPLLTVLFIVVGVQFILMGLLAEILIRIYYESPQKTTYLIKEKINFDK